MQLVIYSSALFASITILVLSIYSLRAPDWIRFDTPQSSPFQYSSTYGLTQKCDRSNLHPEFQCRPFPQRSRDCSSDDQRKRAPHWFEAASDRPLNASAVDARHVKTVPVGSGLVEVADGPESSFGEGEPRTEFGFCEKWITAAYTADLGIVIAIISLFCTFVVLIGNGHRQEHGWKICAGLIAIHAVFQTLTWVLVVGVFNKDDRFYIGSRLSTSTYVAIATSVVDVVALTALLTAGFTGLLACSESDSGNDYEPIG